MKNKIKVILGTIVGIILGTSVTAYAYNYQAKDIGFAPTNESWKVDNVEEAINDLYQNFVDVDNMKVLSNYNDYGEVVSIHAVKMK